AVHRSPLAVTRPRWKTGDRPPFSGPFMSPCSPGEENSGLSPVLTPGFHPTSWGKYFITESTGLGAACPSPHMDASIIAWESSFSSGWSQAFFSISLSVFAVPTRQGVHWPQDSSEKNLVRLRAALVARSWSERI